MGLFRRKKAKVEPLPPDSDYDYTYKLHLAGGHIGGEYGDRQMAIASLQPGQTLDLVREPHNRHDKNAVAVCAGGKQLGYVPAFKAEMTARYLDQGRTVEARVVEITGYVPASKAEEVSNYLSHGRVDDARAALAWYDDHGDSRWRDLFGVLMWLGFKR